MSRSTTGILVIALAAMTALQGCGGGGPSTQPVFQLISPFDDGAAGTQQVDAQATITTNNGTQPLLLIQGRVLNEVDSGVIRYKMENGFGILPFTGPYPIIVTGGGSFDLMIGDPLRHPLTPLEQEAESRITLQATNRFSPIGGDGLPVPVEAFVTVTVKNGVEFTTPAYARVQGGNIVTGCAFNAAAGINGRFSSPSAISGTTLFRVDEADLASPVDPGNPAGTPVPFSFNPSTGQFTIAFDSSGFTAAGFTDGPSDDNNFYIVFESGDPDQLPAPGLIATVPFLACDVAAP